MVMKMNDEKEQCKKLALIYKLILEAAEQTKKTQKQTPKTGEFGDLTDFGAVTQEGNPEHESV